MPGFLEPAGCRLMEIGRPRRARACATASSQWATRPRLPAGPPASASPTRPSALSASCPPAPAGAPCRPAPAPRPRPPRAPPPLSGARRRLGQASGRCRALGRPRRSLRAPSRTGRPRRPRASCCRRTRSCASSRLSRAREGGLARGARWRLPSSSAPAPCAACRGQCRIWRPGAGRAPNRPFSMLPRARNRCQTSARPRCRNRRPYSP
mmetsp:Transcript_18746/g.50388  ORF Transcript_18746/g.50388 Transcript_18746/m.50388 type:complete len:209 (-) Transcript_18746:237-863(-)